MRKRGYTNLFATLLVATLTTGSALGTAGAAGEDGMVRVETDPNGKAILTTILSHGPVPAEKTPMSHSASCGSIAPLGTSCNAVLSSTHAGSLQVTTTLGPGFTGEVTNAGSSSTGSYTWTCTVFAYPLSASCNPIDQTGLFLVGQSILLTGSTSSTAVGTWETSVGNG